MILGQDEAVMFPTVDLYDTGMMNMYANAVREQYQQGLKDYENFVSKYGDFTSPIANDVEYWNLHTMDPIVGVYNDLLANGIDPVRSLEGRAILAQTMRNLPYAKLNQMRESSKIAEEYLKNRGLMAAKGLWNEDFERFLLNGRSIEDWDTSSDGLWTRTSPSEYSDLNQYTGHIFDKMLDLYIETVDGYDYSGVSRDRRSAALTENLLGLLNSDVGRYHFYNAKKDAEIKLGRTPSNQEALQLFVDNILTATSEYDRRSRTENQEYARSRGFYWDNKLNEIKSTRDLANLKALDDYRTNNEIRKEQEKAKISGSSSSSNPSEGESISDALYQLMRGTTGIIAKTSWGTNAGITNYKDFDPDWMNHILPVAQEELATKYYTKDISGGGDASVVVSRNRDMFKLNSKTGKLEKNPEYNTAKTTITNQTPFSPALTRDQKERLQLANRNFINELSTDYSPAKFSLWTNRKTASDDNTMINISNDDDVYNRIYSVDEIALSSYGANRPKYDLDYAAEITNGIRKSLNGGRQALYMKSVGKIVTCVASDGAVHMYQLVNVYNTSGSGEKRKFIKNDKIGVVAYDMGIDTYSNPNFGINNNTDINLYFDENKDADTRWSGDQNVLHWQHLSPSKINSNIAYPLLP